MTLIQMSTLSGEKVEYAFNILEAELMALKCLILRKHDCGKKG